MLCFSLPPSGLNAGAFYALSTLLTRMVIFHYPVRASPKLTNPGEKEISSVWAGAGEVVWYGVCSRIWREVALGLSPRSGSSQQCESWLLASLSSHSLFSKEAKLLIERLILELEGNGNPLNLVWFSRSVMSDSLQAHELQHARPPCPSPTPGAHSNSCPSSW